MGQISLYVEILWPALVAGLLILTTHLPLGREVLLRGIIFLDLAIAQIAAFGVILAKTFWSSDHSDHTQITQTLIAIVAAVTGSMGLYSLRKFEIRVQEAIIGILFILAATGSILLLAADPHGGERLKTILVGQILWLEPKDLIPLAVIYTMIVLTWFTLRAIIGDLIFYPLFAITITLSTQVVGVYLVFASLIIPSLATLHHPHWFTRAFIIGATGYISGLLISAVLDLPAGAAIAWCLALVALFYFLLSKTMIIPNRTTISRR